MTTITQLVDRIQLLLNDTAGTVWAQTDIEEWVVSGIREYSVHFPRTITSTGTTTAGEREIDLDEDFIAVLQVEFPRTDDPPHHYLKRLPRTHPDFWLSDDYYDVEPANANPTAASTLYLSAMPAGESIGITYAASHLPLTTTIPPSLAAITVASYHEQIVEQYAVWQAYVKRLSTEVQNPDLTIRLMQQYKLAVQVAEASYRSSLRQALQARAAGGWTGPWRMDKNDRIY